MPSDGLKLSWTPSSVAANQTPILARRIERRAADDIGDASPGAPCRGGHRQVHRWPVGSAPARAPDSVGLSEIEMVAREGGLRFDAAGRPRDWPRAPVESAARPRAPTFGLECLVAQEEQPPAVASAPSGRHSAVAPPWLPDVETRQRLVRVVLLQVPSAPDCNGHGRRRLSSVRLVHEGAAPGRGQKTRGTAVVLGSQLRRQQQAGHEAWRLALKLFHRPARPVAIAHARAGLTDEKIGEQRVELPPSRRPGAAPRSPRESAPPRLPR